MENEVSSHEAHLESIIAVGEALIGHEHFGATRVQDRLKEIKDMWKNLQDLTAQRRRRLEEAVDFHQFIADAVDVEIWMLDTLRLVSSEDVGRDEANVESLLRKHNDVAEELKNYEATIEALHKQASELGEHDRESTEVRKSISL